MLTAGTQLVETVTLSEAKELMHCLAHEESLLLLSPPGVGKSETVAQAAAEAGLECRSLLGTQIAPEDVSGVPRIVGERSVFCPPRILLPESPQPFCLFLDELPACTPDIQKAFYSLLLERRIGEHVLPRGSWVVAAGNRAEDRALVRTISSALVNRVFVLNVRVDLAEWRLWAGEHGVRREILDYVGDYEAALLRPIPREPVPFSTPRAWTLLSAALDLAEEAGILDERLCQALARGRLSPQDAGQFSTWWAIVRRAREDVSDLGPSVLFNLGVWDLGLSSRAVQALESAGLATVRNLVVFSRQQLLKKCPALDEARVREIQECLERKGLWLGMDSGQLPAG